MNKMILVGNLTRDPELRMTPNGITVCNFTIAVNEHRTGQQENGRQTAQFFQITAWRQLGESCSKYLAKGRKVFVSGPLKASTYTANDGSVRIRLEVTADDVEFLSSKADAEAAQHTQAAQAAQAAQTTQTTQSAPPAAAPSNIDPETGFETVETEELPF